MTFSDPPLPLILVTFLAVAIVLVIAVVVIHKAIYPHQNVLKDPALLSPITL